MPAPKGSNNAKAYQDFIKSKNKGLVEQQLAKFKDARAIFNSITALSKAVAKETGLSDITIRRNKDYRALITQYISEQRGRSGYVSRAEAELTELRHKVTLLELQLSNTSQDNDRLRAYLKKLQGHEDAQSEIAYCPSASSAEIDWQENCQRTYYLVHALLARAEFVVNFEKYAIEDVIAVGDDEIVAGANLAQPYVDWFKRSELKKN